MDNEPKSGSASQPLLWSPERSLNRMGDDRGLLLSMIGFFSEDAPEMLTKLKETIQQGEQEEATRYAHSLKGLCSNYDAEVAISKAQEVEVACRKGDLAAAAGKLDTLGQRIDELDVELQRWSQNQEA